MKYFSILDDLGGGGGGGNKLPDPPKNYAPISVQGRADWNDFLDYANKQGVDFDKNPQAGIQLMSQYKKANPNFSISPNQIINIQYEQQQLRKGDTFGSLKPEQLKYLRQGLPDTYLNRPLSDPNGQFNANTSKLYYPQKTANGKTYGTDIEGYVNGVGGQLVANAAPPPTGKAGAVTAPQTSPQGERPTYNNLPAGVTPRPDYDDPKSRLNYLLTLEKDPANKFLVNTGRGDTILHIDDVPYGGVKTAKQSAIDAAKGVGLDPAILYSSANEEGANGLHPNAKGEITTDPKIDLNGKYPISGFVNYGLDNFHDNFKEMVKRGYLPKDFDYQKDSSHKNENGDTVNSGNFKSPDDAMTAKAAYMRMEQDNLDDWSKGKGGGVQLSPTAKQFFTMMAFNGGPGTAHKLINYYKSKGLLEGDKFLSVPPPDDVDTGHSYAKVLPRLQMANLLKKEAYFPVK